MATLVLDTAPRSVDRSLMFYMHHILDIKTKEDYCSLLTHYTLMQPQVAGVLAPREPGPRQLGAGHGGAAAAAAAGRGGAAGGGAAAGGLGAALRAARQAGAEGHHLGGDAQAGRGAGTGLWWVKTTSRPLPGQYPPHET